jgi:hypothetical protein
MKAVSVYLMAILLFASCGKQTPEETYQGKRMSEWLGLLADRDVRTRVHAIDALGKMNDPAATKAVLNAAKNATTPLERAAAMESCSEWMSDEELLATMSWIMGQGSAEAACYDQSVNAINRLKTKASPLIPLMKNLRGPDVGLRTATDAQRYLLGSMIETAGGKID